MAELIPFLTAAAPYLTAATTVMSAAQARQAGAARQRQYNAQARQKQLEGRVDALNYKREGIEALKEARRIIASNIAAGAAGNLNPFESGGSIALVNQYAMRGAATDFNIARDNAQLAELMANQQSQQLLLAGQDAKRAGTRKALTTIATGAASLGATGYNPSATGPSLEAGGLGYFR